MSVEEGTLPVGDTGEFLATTIVTNSDGVEVHREEIIVTDPSDLDARANVRKIDQVIDYGAIVHSHELVKLTMRMDELIMIQRCTLKLLAAAFEDSISGSEISDGDF